MFSVTFVAFFLFGLAYCIIKGSEAGEQIDRHVSDANAEIDKAREDKADLARLEMSARLAYDDEPRAICPMQRRDNRGYIVASCTRELFHESETHVDCHTGARWVVGPFRMYHRAEARKDI
jgi:hypothetical protein